MYISSTAFHHVVQALTQFAVHAANALMATVLACTAAPADAQPATATLQNGNRPDKIALLWPKQARLGGRWKKQATGDEAPGALLDDPASVLGVAEGAAGAPQSRHCMTTEQRQWLYDLASDVIKGVRTRPPTVSICASLGGLSMHNHSPLYGLGLYELYYGICSKVLCIVCQHDAS